METTPKNAGAFNRKYNYEPQTIEKQDQAVDVTTREMDETPYRTQEDAITTNIVEESSTTAGDNETQLSQNEERIETGEVPTTSNEIQTTINVEKETTNVERETTMGIEIQTTDENTAIQDEGTDFEPEGLESTTVETLNEDTAKDPNLKTFKDETTTIQDDGTEFETEGLETTVETLNKLLWNTLVEEQNKDEPDNYNRMNSENGELDSDEVYEDEDRFTSQEETKKAVDIKERKYKIINSTDDKQSKGTFLTEQQENETSTVANGEDDESKGYEGVGDYEDDDFDYQHADTSKLNRFLIILIFCTMNSDYLSNIKERQYKIPPAEKSDSQRKPSDGFDDFSNEEDNQGISG